MRRFFAYGPSVLVLLTVVVTLLAAPTAIRQMQVARIGAKVTQAQARLEAGTLLDQLDREIQAVADASMPGVVHVEVQDRRGFFRTQSNGAGWVYDDAGHIVTNAHVVGNASSVRVEFFDGRVRDADVIGVDVHTDIAVLKADPSPAVFPLPRASRDPLPIGSQVFAFGSPFGIKFSMSRGVVSGLGRSEAAGFLGMINGYTNFIQTDAAMNPGNSGGPLVDTNGRVVGMNAAIANGLQASPDRDGDEPEFSQPMGQSAGIGFAIPIETVEATVDQLMSSSVVLRGYLGVQMVRRTPSEIIADVPADSDGELGVLRRALNGFVGSGVLVAESVAGEPAAVAGIEDFDVITSVNGRETPTNDVLRSIVSVQRPGSEIDVTVWRGGDEVALKVRIGAAVSTNSGLRYISGSESMTLEEIRSRAGGRVRSE